MPSNMGADHQFCHPACPGLPWGTPGRSGGILGFRGGNDREPMIRVIREIRGVFLLWPLCQLMLQLTGVDLWLRRATLDGNIHAV